jgi:methylmalonyl-CoA mutase C-terminal domain/subunit
MDQKIRVLVAKAGLDGHDRGAKVIAAALRDAGMEVIYTGLRQTPEMIVEAALQEDVDVIGISILSGAHMTVFPKVRALMVDRGIGDVLLTGGGIISDADIAELKKIGVGDLFTPGAPTTAIVDYIRKWAADRSEV